MVCGIDVYHAGLGTGVKRSVAGFVASLNAQLTKWHSRVSMQTSGQELVDVLQMCLVSAVNAYHKVIENLYLICIYRCLVASCESRARARACACTPPRNKLEATFELSKLVTVEIMNVRHSYLSAQRM